MRTSGGFWGIAALLLLAMPALAAPQAVTLGAGDPVADPVAACGELAASPYESGWAGRGHTDAQIYLDGALTACEAAAQASPDSAETATWLARVYTLVGRAIEAAPLLDGAAPAGNRLAAYLLSHLLSGSAGNDVESDDDRAKELLKQASDAGFAPAETELAATYETGADIGPDYPGALKLYQLAAAQNEPTAIYKLGYFYQNGLGTDQDYAKAMQLFQQAADAGEPLGWNGIGQLWQLGQGVAQDNARAIEAYQHGADAGEKMAETALAYFYEQGLGVEKDYDKSFALLTDAAAQDYGFAQASLALHYLYGEGTAVDADHAYPLAWAAVNQQVNYAEGILGYMLAEGLGTPRDLDEALEHFQTGAAGGDQFSADRVSITEAEIACADQAGSQYESSTQPHGLDFVAIDAGAAISACEAAVAANSTSVGDKVWLGRAYARAERYDEALPLLQQGIEAGSGLAQVTYGDLQMSGIGMAQDQAAAVKLYRAAGDAEFPLAQYALGVIYANGMGVPADPQVALGWFRKAYDAGMEEAQQQIDLLSKAPSTTQTDLSGFGREGLTY